MDMKEEDKGERGCSMNCSTMVVLFIAYVVLLFSIGESVAFIALDALFIYSIIVVAYYIRKLRSDGETRKEASQRWGCWIAVCGLLIVAVVFVELDRLGFECEEIATGFATGFALFGLFGIIRRVLRF